MPKPSIPQEEFEEKRAKYTHAQPFTKESLLYREIFEKYYPGQSQMIVDFWMPNKSWEGCNVNDPSARVLCQLRRQREITGFPRLHGQTKVPIFAPQKRHISWK